METPFGNNLDNFSGVPTPAFPGMNGNRGPGEFGFEQNNLDPSARFCNAPWHGYFEPGTP